MRKPNWFERWIFGQYGWQWSEWAHRWTQGRYIPWSFQGKDPSGWPRWAHELTRWDHYPPYFAEHVVTWKDRRKVSTSEQMEWPESFHGLQLRGTRPGIVSYVGRTSGNEMQLGTAAKRPLSWGYAEWGKREDTTIPLPAIGHYRTGGFPTPMFDRHCVITDPVDGSVHEMIQFDPAAPWREDTPLNRILPNQALGWGRWVEGVLIEGATATATDLPMHGYTWTRDSATSKHACAVVIHDYVGADGALTIGPKAGELLALDTDSDSYNAMINLGGECAAVAEAMAEYGVRVIDRNGYSDVAQAGVHQNVVGRKPHPPGWLIHADAALDATNIDQFSVTLTDFRRASS